MELEKFGTAGDIQELLAVRDRIEGLLGGHADRDANLPKGDLLDLGDAYRMVLEVPGVPQENLEIALQGDELVIAGIREAESNEGRTVFAERATGPFHRVVHLPAPVEREKTMAHLHEGLLIVTMPKR